MSFALECTSNKRIADIWLSDIGSNVMDWPLEGQRGLADGHEICSHTWSHPCATHLASSRNLN